jgi:hypothetical protein
VNGFRFSAACECGGELAELTHSKPHGFQSSCRVVCRVCGRQFDIEVRMSRHVHQSEEVSRQQASDSLVITGDRL